MFLGSSLVMPKTNLADGVISRRKDYSVVSNYRVAANQFGTGTALSELVRRHGGTCRAAWLDFRALLLLIIGAGLPVVSAPRGMQLSLDGAGSSCSGSPCRQPARPTHSRRLSLPRSCRETDVLQELVSRRPSIASPFPASSPACCRPRDRAAHASCSPSVVAGVLQAAARAAQR